MITEQDLLEAIAECQGQRNPNANTCIKLAAYYTILNNLQSDNSTLYRSDKPAYSYAQSDSAEKTVEYHSNSDFATVINNKSALKMWAIIDELMTALMVINPRLYNDVMQKLNE